MCQKAEHTTLLSCLNVTCLVYSRSFCAVDWHVSMGHNEIHPGVYSWLSELVTASRYFRRLQKRYTPDPDIKAALKDSQRDAGKDADSDTDSSKQDPSLQLPITCINLLRCSMQVNVSLESCCCGHSLTSMKLSGLCANCVVLRRLQAIPLPHTLPLCSRCQCGYVYSGTADATA